MILILTHLILNAGIAWSGLPNAESFIIKLGEAPGKYYTQINTWKTCQIGVGDVFPGHTYYFRVYSVINGIEYPHTLEGNIPYGSKEIVVKIDYPSSMLIIDGYKNMRYKIQTSSDLKTWTDEYTGVAPSDYFSIVVNMNQPMMFYRIQRLADMQAFFIVSEAQAISNLRRVSIGDIKSPLTGWQKFKLLFRYREGMHPGEIKKGAEKLKEK